jgi:hypothetical protein
MRIRRTFAVLTLTGVALGGLGGNAFAANSPTNVPGPCTDPISMPEYCSDPNDGDGGDPEPKPGGHITDFTNGDQDDVLEARGERARVKAAPTDPAPQTREHVLLARQVG